MHIWLFSFMHFIEYRIVYCYAWVKGELLWSLSLIHAYITPWVLSSSKRGRLLAQRSITLVLMITNSCSYSTSDLVFIYSQIFDQDLSRCLASTKDSKSSFRVSTYWFKSSHVKIASNTRLESSSFRSCLDQDGLEKFYKKTLVCLV